MFPSVSQFLFLRTLPYSFEDAKSGLTDFAGGHVPIKINPSDSGSSIPSLLSIAAVYNLSLKILTIFLSFSLSTSA
jgi:hypothetical protein